MLMNYEDLEDLAQEHTTMLQFLAREETRTTPSSAWPLFVRLLGAIHHHKEEHFLFPLMLGSSRLEVGGPKCMTFFTPRAIGGTGWEDAFARLQRMFPGPSGPLPEERTPFRDRVLTTGSMLKIPLEDHVAGARAIKLLEYETDFSRRATLLSAFAGLLRDHIQREDECLFEMFRQALTPEQKLYYAKQAAEFDLENDTAGLLRALSEL